MDQGKLQKDQEWFGAIECILFVSGEPVDMVSLQRTLGLTELELQSILGRMLSIFKCPQQMKTKKALHIISR